MPLEMRVLLVGLQVAIGYLALSVFFGAAQSPKFNVADVVVVATFFVGLFLITLLVPRLGRGAKLSPVRSKRLGLVSFLCLLAIGMVTVGHGVLVGVWRGPARLTAIHRMSEQFASAWSLAAIFFLVGALCLAYAARVLRHAEA